MHDLDPHEPARPDAAERLCHPAPRAAVDARPAGELRRLPDVRLGAGARRDGQRCTPAAPRQEHPRRDRNRDAAQGLHRVAGNPDLRIAYETAKAEKVENNPVRVGIGVGSWGGNVGGSVNVGSPSIRNFTEGTLVIHAVDAGKQRRGLEGQHLRQADQRQRRAGGDTARRLDGDAGFPGADGCGAYQLESESVAARL